MDVASPSQSSNEYIPQGQAVLQEGLLMWSQLFTYLVKFIQLAQVWCYIDEFEKAVVLRAGRYKRTIGPGAHLLWPLGVEDRITVNVKPEPVYIDNQSAHCKGEWLMNFQVGMVFRVTNPKKYLVDNEDTEDLIKMLVADLVRRTVQSSTWAEVNHPDFIDQLKVEANKKARKRGASIDELVLVDMANGRADRIWHEGVSLNVGEEE